MTTPRLEDSIEFNEKNSYLPSALPSKLCAHQKQSVSNFFDFEDEDDANVQDSFTNTQSIHSHFSELTSIKNQTNEENDFTEECSFDIEFECDIDQIAEIINSTVNSIISPSKSSISLTTRQAVEQIFSGYHDVNLSLFKGKEQKLELLDYAVLIGDKYTLTKVILYLEHTLKSSIFFYELIRRPVAADHYLLYLRSTEQWDQQLNLLNMMGRYEDAAFAIYTRAIESSAEPQQQIKLLERSLLNFTTGGTEVTQWQSYIREHITLLEQQLPIEADDRRRSEEALKQSIKENQLDYQTKLKLENNQLFVIYERPCLIGLPLMETLRYCCLYHYHLPDNNFASPFYLKKMFHISDRQFLWIALQSLSKTARWTEIDNLFEYKSWLGSRKIRNIVPINDIVEVLYQNSAPLEMLEKYLDLMADVERKLQLAKEFHMNKYAADILIKLRDRKRLSELQSLLRTKSEMDYVQHYINNILVNSAIKWRN